MKKTVKFALKQFGIHWAGTVAALFLIAVCSTLWSGSDIFQWIVTALSVIVHAIFLYIPAANQGVVDYMHDELLDRHDSPEPRSYSEGKGFLAGLLSQIPVILVYGVSLLLPPDGAGRYVGWAVKGWYFMFSRFNSRLGFPLWSIVLFGTAFAAVTAGLSYKRGKELRIRTRTVISRNDSKRERMKTRKKN